MEEAVKYLVDSALRKKEIVSRSVLEFYLRAMLATVYIGLAAVVCIKIGQQFHEFNSPATYLMNALFFGMALVLIIYGGAELFTGNTMYFTVGLIRKETTVKDLIINWFNTYAGNLLGAILIAGIITLAGTFHNLPENHILFEAVTKKINYGTTELFFKGILCNWLVCLACFLPARVKGDGPKIFIMVSIVFMFFISGYEHSIANMFYFALTFMSHPPEAITYAGAIHNLVPVTLGNIVGGVLFVGCVYAYLTRESTKA